MATRVPVRRTMIAPGDPLDSHVLERTRKHARRIRDLITAPYPQNRNSRIYRAMYVCDGHVVAASIHQIEGQPLYVQVQLRHGEVGGQNVQGIASAKNTLTAEEIAVFFGLDAVSPDELLWDEQSYDGRAISSAIAVVHGSLDRTKNN